MSAPTLISESYRSLNRELHESDERFGAKGHRWSAAVRGLLGDFGLANVLDYGCGKQTLKAALPGIEVRGYDPAFEALARAPEPADLVYCGDVLEHVEPDFVPNVLDDLRRVTRCYGLFVIATRPARKTLPDGRNAHLSQMPASRWAGLLAERFDLVYMQDFVPELRRPRWRRALAGWAAGGVHNAVPKRGEVVFLVRAQGYGGGQRS